ncbi:hypothetical protein WMY93_026773 [Mugilogobius chulae]|uniref:Riboflavin transporter n=1 Tax=Mugilogobius chulae TaxID=88201 RepID=A0AAW0N581_9GOBI
MGSWVAINGMWVELPLIVPDIPEGWYLPSYLTVLIQMANIGPLFITLMHRFRPGTLDERPVVYSIVVLGVIATFLLAFFWKHKVIIGESSHSVPLLVLSFLLSVVDCTSSVTFLPFMMRLHPQYLTTYFAGDVLPSVQTYSCLPYGNQAYHLAATMAAVANPVACFIAMFVPQRSLILMGVLTLCGTGFASYIMAMAAMSPCPLLVHSTTGSTIIVLAWILFVLSLSYVKVIIGVILRDEGHSALVWCGAVVQLGSMVGAIAMFPEHGLQSSLHCVKGYGTLRGGLRGEHRLGLPSVSVQAMGGSEPSRMEKVGM